MTPKWIRRHLEPGEIVLHIARPGWLRVVAALAFIAAIVAPAWAILEFYFGSVDLKYIAIASGSFVFVCSFLVQSRIALTNRRVLHWDPLSSFDQVAAYDHRDIRGVEISRLGLLRSAHLIVGDEKRIGIFGMKDVGTLVARLKSTLGEEVPLSSKAPFDWKAFWSEMTPPLWTLYGTLWMSCALIAWLWPLVTDGGSCGIITCIGAGLRMLPVIAAALFFSYYLALPLAQTLWSPFTTTKERRAVARNFLLLGKDGANSELQLPDWPWNMGTRYVNWLCGGPIDRPLAENEATFPRL